MQSVIGKSLRTSVNFVEKNRKERRSNEMRAYKGGHKGRRNAVGHADVGDTMLLYGHRERRQSGLTPTPASRGMGKGRTGSSVRFDRD